MLEASTHFFTATLEPLWEQVEEQVVCTDSETLPVDRLRKISSKLAGLIKMEELLALML